MTSPSVAPAHPYSGPAAPLTGLQGLHPGWFGAVMGTAVVGIAAYTNPGHLQAMLRAAHVVGVTFVLLAAVLGVGLGGAYLARWTRHPGPALADLRHPVLGALYGTVPGGLLVLAVAVPVVAPTLGMPDGLVVATVAVLAAVGTVLGFALSLIFAYLLFTGDIPGPLVNGGWFIPPVVTIIVPVALAPLVAHVQGSTARVLVALGYAFYGMGLLLFLLVMSLLHDRLVLHPLPGPPMAPSLWIGLGPIGVGALALLSLATAARPVLGEAEPAVAAVSRLAATGLWGFGLWWLAAAVALLVRYLRHAALPYGPGWWAFTFPLGAYTLATLTLARAWDTAVLEWIGVALFLALLGFWATVTTHTLRAVGTGQAWTR